MKLSYLIKDCVPLWERMFPIDLNGSNIQTDPDISSIHSDSRSVKPGGLFIAVKGFETDGHNYINDAFERGAVAVVSEQRMQGNPMVVQVKDTRKAMASIAARFYGYPSRDVCLVGITGTNGKTTTAWILESIFNEAGFSSGVIGTINMRYGGRIHDTSVTTPDSIELQKALFDMKMAGVTHVIMEVSSHGIDLNRIADCDFDVGVFTNLTQDHLDYHKTMGRYFSCKKRFFTKFLIKGTKASKAAAVINIDSEYGEKIAHSVKVRLVKTSCDCSAKADLKAENIKEDISGMKGAINIAGKSFPFRSGFTGHFNLENMLSAAGSAYALGIAPEIIIRGIEKCSAVPGRLERIETSGKRFIFVDYAHTPDAMENILKTLRQRAPARLICVFGCGGDRDKKKRPLMGKIALKYCDLSIVTSDNPRSEPPISIIQDILKGMEEESPVKYSFEDIKFGFNARGFFVEPDRKQAIETALMVSGEDDIIVVSGKGHETYQVLSTGTIDFDDRQIIKDALADYEFKWKHCSHTNEP